MDEDVKASETVTSIRLSANIAMRSMYQYAADPTPAAASELSNTVSTKIAEMRTGLAELQDLYPLEDKTLLNQFTEGTNNWLTYADQIVAYMQQNNVTAVMQTASSGADALSVIAALDTQMSETLGQVSDDAINSEWTRVRASIFISIIVMIILAIALVIVAGRIIRSIIEPTQEVRDALVQFSHGKFDAPVSYTSSDELGQMCEALRSSQHSLVEVIDDVSYLLEEMANGNFDVRTKGDELYVGDMSRMLMAIRGINRKMSEALEQIDQSADQVSADAEQVSTGAQALAQGATEQASVVQQLSATIKDLSDSATENAKHSEQAMGQAKNAGAQVTESVANMEEMVAAMDRISQASEEISKIIATIENIAFQTNILALNAAVEAARAGSAGKGFAVVADEVRNLASKSDQAAKATKELIERCNSSVLEGNAIVQRVSDSLKLTAERTEKTSETISMIAQAAASESTSITQVAEGIHQISAVVQTNSATSEESAAASEELSTQASLMKDMMSKFTLRSDSGYTPQPAQESYENGEDMGPSSYSKY
jgi:methyl-accepting chemotaxis protein